MTQSLVAAVQLLTKSTLPEDFLRFVEAGTAGELSGFSFNVPHPSGAWTDGVDSFYTPEEMIDWIEIDVMLREQGTNDLPDGMFPIAGNGMGDHILLSLRPSEHGSVYLGFHEEMDLESGSDAGLIKLSATFSEWLSALRPGEDED
ncbi:MAG: / family [Rariglobus sp.]|jgi:hypothetical protein|nr:/ family [Rariglobus sp.]